MNLASNWKGAGPSDGRSVGLSSGWGGDRIVPLGVNAVGVGVCCSQSDVDTVLTSLQWSELRGNNVIRVVEGIGILIYRLVVG